MKKLDKILKVFKKAEDDLLMFIMESEDRIKGASQEITELTKKRQELVSEQHKADNILSNIRKITEG